MVDINALNTRLAAFQLPGLTDPHTLPEGVTLERITHALGQAERGQGGARLFLLRHLANQPAAAPKSPPPRASAGHPPGAPVAAPSTAAPVPTSPAASPAASPAPVKSASAARPEPTPPARPTPGRGPSAPPPARAPDPVPTREPAASRSVSVPKGSASVSRERVQCRIYGSKAALCIEIDVTRPDEPTLRLEAALATGPRAYDWKQKIALHLTREELPVITATVLGLLPRCVYKNHGPEQNKGLEIEHQGRHLFVRLFQKDRGVLAIPVSPVDRYYLAALAVRPLRQAAPWLSDQSVLTALKLTVQRMSAAQNVKQ